MNFQEYLAPLRKWWRLLLAATVLAAVASFAYSLTQPPVYQVRTTLMIGNTLSVANPSGGEFYLQEQLGNIYAGIAMREPIRNDTMKELGLSSLPTYEVRPVTNSPLLEIVVSDSSPERTMAVANELARQLVNRSPGIQSENTQVQEFLKEQIAIVQNQITETRAEQAKLQEQIVKLNSARQIADMQSQIDFQTDKINELQSTYASLLANTQQGATNTLSVIEEASLPTYPVGPNRLMTVGLAALIALVLSTAAAYIIEFLDDSIKSIEEVKRLLKYPIVGQLGEFPKGANPWSYITEEPRAPISHAFRVLRTNLYLLDNEQPIRSILVTSAGTAEGKSTIAGNLSMVMSQGERKVVCVEADFHRPVLHDAVPVENDRGLSDVFKGSLTLHESLVPWNDGKLRLIPAGELPENPTELLGSKKMDQILESLSTFNDLIIIDGPPFFLADTSVLSTKVDLVLLIVRPGYTRRDAISAIRDQLAKLHGVRVAIVMNRVPAQDSYYSKYYPYEYRKKKSERSKKVEESTSTEQEHKKIGSGRESV